MWSSLLFCSSTEHATQQRVHPIHKNLNNFFIIRISPVFLNKSISNLDKKHEIKLILCQIFRPGLFIKNGDNYKHNSERGEK